MEIPTDHLHKMTIEEFDTSKLLINAARQRDQRNLQDTLVVDVDCHHYENESMAEIIEFIEDPVLREATTAEREAAFVVACARFFAALLFGKLTAAFDLVNICDPAHRRPQETSNSATA